MLTAETSQHRFGRFHGLGFVATHVGKGLTAFARFLLLASIAVCQVTVAVLSMLCQGALGVSCILIGVAMTMTFWLIPLGLPLALLGVALLHPSANTKARA